MKYKNLFSKGRISNLILKNRVIMLPMSVGIADKDGNPTDETISYYKERARGGVGLIILGALKVNDKHGTIEAHQLSIAHDENIYAFKKLVDVVHQYDVKVFAQLAHPGRQTFSILNGERSLVAPSAIPCVVCRQETRALTVDEIEEIIQDFVEGAARLKNSGMDGVELHAAHGYLINQFLSPYTNKRTDEYGGCFENRMKFIAEIIQGIRDKCGKNYPISVRLSSDEFLKDFGIKEEGITLKEGVKISKYLENIGVDAINVSSGVYATTNTIIEPISYEQGWRKHLSKAVKRAVNIPVIGANIIRKPSFAESLLEEDVVDFVALGRGLIAESEWVNKAKEHREKEIRPCISCLNCIESVLKERPMECAVNAVAGKELIFKDIKKDGKGRTVVIIGAGPAGMEAAKVLAMRGFKPVIFEKENRAGGQLQLANKPPKKEKITWLIEYMLEEMNRLGATLRLSTKATIEEIRELNPYAVFIATGSKPLIPAIEGINGKNVHIVPKVLKGQVKLEGKKVVVIGSGMTGLETAEFLAEQGNQVMIIEMLNKIGKGIYTPNRMDILRKLNKYRVQMLPSYQLEKIIDKKMIVRNLIKDELIEREVDHVVLSLGVKPENKMVEEIKKNFDNVKVIGDANKIGRVGEAIKAGFMEGYNL
ncbi:NAD(P)/FAD-dependent oxidoreductase [Crassaminicella profunda]|uniref:NAD(P)/FAD-dependent oxidoreductase n=1 Tax=Crassaminicella profunda TaxID=1286698 RepID=UPI001CA71972|nr:NAD(P)/FAD-dependent oxidoreductase [Crassaminicella profunda]QZY56169.1 NAD(P)/FAD-dependent oxidoreductase [Crassaminicella profunda]